MAAQLNTAELLAQLNQMIAEHEAIAAESQLWHDLIGRLDELGYGPAITPEQIANLILPAGLVARISESSRAPKSGPPGIRRRRRQPDDHRGPAAPGALALAPQ